jgi:hypothetical protein
MRISSILCCVHPSSEMTPQSLTNISPLGDRNEFKGHGCQEVGCHVKHAINVGYFQLDNENRTHTLGTSKWLTLCQL